jgi:hypothetical protein
VQSLSEDGAATMDAYQRYRPGHLSDRTPVPDPDPDGVLLDDLVRDPHERAAHMIAIEDDRALLQPASCSFQASPDRVKGAYGCGA